MPIAEASAALSSIKAAFDIAKNAVGLQNSTEINLAVIGIQRALLDAQSAAFNEHERQASLQKRISELEASLAQAHNWEAEKARYRLTEAPTGKLTYALKPECAGDEPSHHLCVTCFNVGKKSVMQIRSRNGGGESVICPTCNVTLVLNPFPPIDMGRIGGTLA